MPSQHIDPGAFTGNERVAIEIATKHNRVTPRALAAEAQISRRTASAVLKDLETRKILRWSGKSANDPHQFYDLPK